MYRPRQLSAAFVKTVKEPGRYGDGRGGYGLSLLVKESTTDRLSKSWAQRLRINGQPFNIGLGSYPVVTLARARELALENRRRVEDGIDPRTPVKTIPTFADAIESAIAVRAAAWKNPKTEKLFRAVLDRYAMPAIGKKLVSDITSGDVLAILSPIWVDVPEQAKRTKESISTVMEWARVEGHRADNPADRSILKALPKRGLKKHFKALPFAEVGAAIQNVKATDAYWSTKSAFEFIALTACRSGEARQATWNEMDLDAATWTIPAARMKNGREHRVPLSGPVLAILDGARELTGGTGLVFPSLRGREMTDNTISKLLRDNRIETTPHGLRSAFRDWSAEKTDFPREICEHALAHVEGSASELAYRRTDYFEKRRELMQQWSGFLTRETT